MSDLGRLFAEASADEAQAIGAAALRAGLLWRCGVAGCAQVNDEECGECASCGAPKAGVGAPRLREWASSEDKAYHTIVGSLEDEGYFLDDEAHEVANRLAQHVAQHPCSNSEWEKDLL